MGKLKITGKAEREVQCDVMTLTLVFRADASDSSVAVKKSDSECEEFLGIIEKWGIDISALHLESDDIDVGTDYNSRSKEFSSKRIISLRTTFDMKLLNAVKDLIREHSYEADLSVEFEYSGIKELHEELIGEAVEDSRKKADRIAAATGQKIVGIKELICGSNFDSYPESKFMVDSSSFFLSAGKTFNNLSSKLSSPLIKESESVSIIWQVD